MNYDTYPVRLLYNDEELKQRILMIIESHDTITGCTFVNLCSLIAKMAFTEHKVKKVGENTTIINEELAVEEQARMSCVLWELIWEHKIVLLFGHSEMHGLSNGEERFVKYSKSTTQPSVGGSGIDEIPGDFAVNNINFKVLSKEDKTVEVAKSPQASGTITIPSRVTTHYGITYDVVGIGDGAFDRNKNITDVSLPDSIKYVGELAFCGVSSKRAITLPKSLESIGRSAFNSEGLTFSNLDLPSGLKEIKQWAFACAMIATKKVRIPASVCSMELAVFQQCNIESIEVDEGNAYYKSIEGVLFSKNGDTLIEYPAESPRQTYEVPMGVKIIGQRAFFCCKNVKRIILPNTVRNISMDAFYSNPSLAVLEIRATTPPTLDTSALRKLDSKCVVYVHKGCAARYKATAGWKELASRIVEEGSPQPVEGNSPAHPTPPIGENKPGHPSSFVYNGLNYKVLSVEDKTVEVDKNPYASGAITIPPEVVYYGIAFKVVCVGKEAFLNNKKVTTLSLLESIIEIKERAFDSSWIQRINIPAHVEKIGWQAFYNMKNVENEIMVPASVKEIGHAAFNNSSYKLKVDLDNQYYCAEDNVLFDKKKSRLIYYMPCRPHYDEYKVPEGVTVIGGGSFQEAKIKHLCLPASLRAFEGVPFFSNKNIRTISIAATNPPTVELSDTFSRMSSDLVVVVPKGCAKMYKTAEGWRELNIVEA